MDQQKGAHRCRSSICDFLCKGFNFLIQHLSAFAFVMLLFNLILVSISMFSFPVTSLVELGISGFANELHVLNENK